MTLEEIENKLKSLGLDELLNRAELKHLPSILLEDEEILYAFETRDTRWLGILTERRIIRLKNTALSGLKSKIIELKNIASIEYKDGIIMDKVILKGRDEEFNLAICFKTNAYAIYYGIDAILKGNNSKDAIRNAKTDMKKPPCQFNYNGYGIIGIACICLLFMLKSCFFDDSEESKKKYKLPRAVSIISEDTNSITLQYTFDEIFGSSSFSSNTQLNIDLCRAMTDIVSKNGNPYKINVKGIYRNSTSTEKIYGFEATWWAFDIKNYNCSNYPDIWKHATIDNLWIEFRKMTRKDCEKDDNYNRYFLCSKVM